MRPAIEVATNNGQTYFVTSNTSQRRPFFKSERWSGLFVEILNRYRPEQYLLHAFVLMPDHFHLLLTPSGSLERAVQCVKGGFSFRAKRELQWNFDVWVAGFADHRIRDAEDCEIHLRYIAMNPVKERLAQSPSEYVLSSASGRFELDAFPQWLKPRSDNDPCGGAEAPPFQNKREVPPHATEARPFQGRGSSRSDAAEAASFQSVFMEESE